MNDRHIDANLNRITREHEDIVLILLIRAIAQTRF